MGETAALHQVESPRAKGFGLKGKEETQMLIIDCNELSMALAECLIRRVQATVRSWRVDRGIIIVIVLCCTKDRCADD